MSPTARKHLRRWLGRLTFSFFIIAAVLFWTGYKDLRPGPGEEVRSTRALACFIGGGACLALANAGMRERHRARDDDDARG